MLGLFKRDPKKKLQQAYERKLQAAMEASRNGDMRANATLTEEILGLGLAALLTGTLTTHAYGSCRHGVGHQLEGLGIQHTFRCRVCTPCPHFRRADALGVIRQRRQQRF